VGGGSFFCHRLAVAVLRAATSAGRLLKTNTRFKDSGPKILLVDENFVAPEFPRLSRRFRIESHHLYRREGALPDDMIAYEKLVERMSTTKNDRDVPAITILGIF